MMVLRFRFVQHSEENGMCPVDGEADWLHSHRSRFTLRFTLLKHSHFASSKPRRKLLSGIFILLSFEWHETMLFSFFFSFDNSPPVEISLERFRLICQDQFSHSLLGADFFFSPSLLLSYFFSFTRALSIFFLSLYWDQNNNPQERNTQKYFRISSDKIAQKIMVSLRQTVHMCLFSLRFYVFTIEVFARTHKNTEFVCCDTAPNYYV